MNSIKKQLSILFLFMFTFSNLIYIQVKASESEICANNVMETLLTNHIPEFPNTIIYSNNIEFRGKYKKNVLPTLIQEMKKFGWVEISKENSSETKYFVKSIDKQNIKISIVAVQRGGPEEVNSSTFVYFKIIS